MSGRAERTLEERKTSTREMLRNALWTGARADLSTDQRLMIISVALNADDFGVAFPTPRHLADMVFRRSDARAAERASKHARRINERLERDVPLLLHAGVVAPVTSREAAARLDRRAQHEAEKQAAEHAETLVAVEQLVAHGAASPSGDLRAWLASWLPRITRTRRHHGNHRYVFALSRAAKRVVPASLPYPKFDARACRAMGVTPDLCPL